jgi:hypothetical protein
MHVRRRKSRKAQVANVVGGYLKLKTAGKAAKGMKTAAKGTVAYKVAKRTPVKRVPLVAGAAGAAVAAVVAVKAVRGSSGEAQPT